MVPVVPGSSRVSCFAADAPWWHEGPSGVVFLKDLETEVSGRSARKFTACPFDLYVRGVLRLSKVFRCVVK